MATTDSIPGNAVPRRTFYDNVMGKTGEEIYKLYGKPDSSQSGTDSSLIWFYYHRTYDPAVEKPDVSIQVIFGDDGHVRSINF